MLWKHYSTLIRRCFFFLSWDATQFNIHVAKSNYFEHRYHCMMTRYDRTGKYSAEYSLCLPFSLWTNTWISELSRLKKGGIKFYAREITRENIFSVPEAVTFSQHLRNLHIFRNSLGGSICTARTNKNVVSSKVVEPRTLRAKMVHTPLFFLIHKNRICLQLWCHLCGLALTIISY